MARRPSQRQRLEQLALQFEPMLARAFLDAVADIASKAEIARIVERLERGDVDGALRAVHIDPAAFVGVEEALRAGYGAGGAAVVGAMPVLKEPDGSRMVLRFDLRNPRAESWLTQHSSGLITRIVEDQREAVRSALTSGMVDGTNPLTVALDVVGRVNRATGRREGGILGLTAQQEQFVRNALAELTSSPEEMARFLERSRRDKRFDRTIAKAIRDGEPLDKATVDRILGRYKDRLLQLRGETIARTEMLTALNASQREAFEQAIERGAVARQDVRKVWRSAGDAKVRDSHRAMDGESAGMDERFGNGLLFPHEPGAPPEEVVNCRCGIDYRIDYLANIR